MLENKTIEYLNGNCLSRSIAHKLVIVTGANSGVGYKATEELLFLGADVIMACRNLEKAGRARDMLLADYPDAKIEVRQLNLASRSSISSFVDGIKRDRVDVFALVNNAGVFNVDGTTEDGLEIVNGTNYVGTRTLVEALLPYLQELGHPVTVTLTTSISYRLPNIGPASYRTYAMSKVRITEYAESLAKQLSGTPVKVVLTHPGVSMTGMAMKMLGELKMNFLAPFVSRIFQTPEKSALAIPLVLTNPVDPGTIYGPCGFIHGWGYPSRDLD